LQQDTNTKLLIAVGVGLILSDIIPTPADAVYFNYQQKNKVKLEKGEITPKQYWIRDAVAYYGLNPLWWTGVLGASLLIGKDFKQKRNLLIGLVAGGAVLTILHRNIKRDEEFYSQNKLVQK
jgi:uncharacterized membrane protein YkvI